LHVITVK